MIKNSNFYVVFALVIFIIFILPFLYITKFTYFSGDDICRATANFQNIIEDVSNWYLNHNGRYANAFFSYLPIYNLHVYRIILAFSFSTLIIAYYFFIDSLFSFYNINIPKSKTIFLTVLTSIMVISVLPSVFEYFYWYAGTSAYMYSIILLLILIVKLLKSDFQLKKIDIGLIICLVLLIGNNELLVPLTNLLLILLLLINFFRSNQLNIQLLKLNILSWIGSLVIIFSPGSSNRQSYYLEGGNFLFSFKSALLSSAMFILKEIIQIQNIIFFIGFIFFIMHLKISKKSVYMNPILLAALSFFILGSVFFVPYYAIGHLNVNEGRIGNMIHSIFLILMLVNLINLSNFLKQRFQYNRNFGLKISLYLFGIFLLFTVFGNRNYQNLITDFNNSEFQRFENEQNKRTLLIKNSFNASLKVEKISGSRTIKYYDISGDKNFWSNQCFTEIINSTYEKDFKYISQE